MDTRYVLQVLTNENELVKANKGDFAYICDFDPDQCLGHDNEYTGLGHAEDVFCATFFLTPGQTKEAVKKYGSWGVEYYITKVELKLS